MGRRRSNVIVRALVCLKDQAGNTFSRILGGRRRSFKPKVMKRRRLGTRLAKNKLRLLKRSLKQKSKGVRGRALTVKKKVAKLVTKQPQKHKRKQSRQHRRRIQNAKKLKLKPSSKGIKKKKNSRRKGRRKKRRVAGKKKKSS